MAEVIDTVMLVEGRVRARVFEPLGMRCDGKAIPEPSQGGDKPRYWTARATFTGTAPVWLDGGGGFGATVAKKLEGTLAIAVTATRVFGILTPDLVAEPSAWFSLPRRGLRVFASGQVGMLKKRPSSLRFGAEGWSVVVSEVQLILRHSGRTQPRHESELLAALQAP